MNARLNSQPKNRLTVLVAWLLWLVGFTYATGFGHVHDIYGKAKLITVIFFAFCFLFGKRRHSSQSDITLAVFYILFSNIYYYVRFHKTHFDYLWLFLLLPLMSRLSLRKREMKLISLGYLLGGFVILYAANYTSIFSGWDGNSYSIPAFFSYTVFVVSFGDTREKKKIFLLLLVSAVYFYLLRISASRGSMLFSIILLLSTLSLLPLKRMIKHRAFLLLLLAPLLLAVVVVLIRSTPFAYKLNIWSLNNTQKPFFNGRDMIWLLGFREWLRNPLLGNGNFAGNFHNSAVTLLVGSGAVGYCIYLGAIAKILNYASRFSDDTIVSGLILSYLTIWLHQSLELGLVAPQGNAIPFAILGLLLARTKTLEREYELQNIRDRSDLQRGGVSPQMRGGYPAPNRAYPGNHLG